MSARAAFAADEIRALYTRRARRYGLTSRLYGLLGYRLDAYRRAAVAALDLKPGATVVEVGCGTGANFARLRSAVGASGSVIGVDMTAAMLDRARRRIARHGWSNISLVLTDAAEYLFPPGLDAVFSSFALTLVPRFDTVVRRAAEALRPGGRIAVVDFKAPAAWPPWLLRAIVPLLRPFGVTLDLAARHPWESVARYCGESSLQEYYLGTTYVVAGIKTESLR